MERNTPKNFSIAKVFLGLVAILIGLVAVFANLSTICSGDFKSIFGPICSQANTPTVTPSPRIVQAGSTPFVTVAPTWTATPQAPTPINTPAPINTPQPTATATQTSAPTPLSFPAAPGSKLLTPPLRWQQGNSIANSYDFNPSQPGVLILTAGPGTEQWGGTNTAPMVIYPIKGNFETQVKMVSNPPEGSAQGTDLGVRSAKAASTWLRIGKWGPRIAAFADNNGASIYIRDDKWVLYNDEAVYLKIVRQGARFSLSFSRDGIVWSDIEREFVFPIDDEAEIFLEARSPLSATGVVARFSDFFVIQK